MKRGIGVWLVIAISGLSLTGCAHLQGNKCKSCGPTGCRPAKVGWQRGGTDYQRHLSHSDYRNHQAGSGVPAPSVAYPYYTVRGPRDFLVNNPPTIGR